MRFATLLFYLALVVLLVVNKARAMNSDLPDSLDIDYNVEKLDALNIIAKEGKKPEQRQAEFRQFASGWAKEKKNLDMDHGALQAALRRHPNHTRLQNAKTDVSNKIIQHDKKFDERVAKLGRTQNRDSHCAHAMASCKAIPKRSDNVVRIINEADASPSTASHRSSSSSASSSKSIAKPASKPVAKPISRSTSKSKSSQSRRY